MYASTILEQGDVYTRAQLRELFAIGRDPNLENGVFQPKGYASVWLFVTEKKTADRTPYEDKLDNDTLYWDGQQQGRTDTKVIEHMSRGLELLVFYRTRKYQYPGAAFRYEGEFIYISHSGAHPTHFVLRRVGRNVIVAQQDIDALETEEGALPEGIMSTTLVNRYERNSRLRAAAIALHGTSCMACGFSFLDAYGERGEGFIEVHHVRPLSSYGGAVVVDPRHDLVVLCANCHRMVHRRPNETLSLGDLRALVSPRRQSSRTSL